MVMGSFGGRPGAALMVIASAHVKPGNEENQINQLEGLLRVLRGEERRCGGHCPEEFF